MILGNILNAHDNEDLNDEGLKGLSYAAVQPYSEGDNLFLEQDEERCIEAMLSTAPNTGDSTVFAFPNTSLQRVVSVTQGDHMEMMTLEQTAEHQVDISDEK